MLDTSTTSTLTASEKEKFFNILGRTMADEFLPVKAIRNYLEQQQDSERLGRRYTRQVWSKLDRTAYLDEQAARFVKFAQERRETLCPTPGKDCDPSFIDRTYDLENPHGARHPRLGYVHLRAFPDDISKVGLEQTLENRRRCLTIENIELHPSIRRQGFLRRVHEQLKIAGYHAVAYGVIMNPGWGYRLYRQSLSSNRVVLISGPDSIDFERKLAPGPTFAVIL